MTKQTLLMIDESPAVMALTKRILERAGYLVRCAGSLAGARELLADFTPDGIILEKQLPDGDGLVYCRELRQNFSYPILIFSCDRADELAALHSGATDFIKKPCDYDIMKARINVMLNGNYTETPYNRESLDAPSGGGTAYAR